MKFDFIAKNFPVPQFLNPPHLGLSFSDSNIKVVSFNKSLSDPFLTGAVVSIEDGSIVNGKIVNQDKVIEKLSVIRKKFDLPFVFFTIPDELVYIFSTLIPLDINVDIRENVAFSIEENVPLSLPDTVFDFVPIKIVQNESKHYASLIVAACAQKEIEKFIEIIHRSDFESVGCLHESQAIANALVPKNSSNKLCIIHAREKRIGIYLIKNNIVHFSTLRSILEDNYEQQFLDEYEKFSEYCSKYNIDQIEPIELILVCGEFEYAKRVAEILSDKEDFIPKVKLSNVWTNVLKIEKETPSISYEDSLNLAGPIGAVLSDII